jgi:ribosomal protein S27AE
MMIIQSAYQAPTTRLHPVAKLRRPKCPRCGSVVLVAEESRFNARGRVDHTWSCDDCGNVFLTSIRLWRP